MKKTILPSIVVLLILLGLAPAETRLVPEEYAIIQDAIDAAVDGDVVIISPYIYTGRGNRDIDFRGKAITVRSVDPNDANIIAATIIDCDGRFEEPHRGFYFHSGEDGNSVLSGLTITNGYASCGGAIYCASSHPTITNCTFRDNTARYWWEPWGQFSTLSPNENSSPMVNDDDEVHINIPPPLPEWRGKGGGICCGSSSPTLTNCKFIGNSAVEYGGGMYNTGSSPTLTNCTFVSNSASYGGAMRNSSGSPILINCTFISNWASRGGAMQNSSSSPSLFNCIFNGNSAGWDGGCMSNYRCNPMLTNCTFNKNSARYNGGVIFNTGSDATLSNCILWGNTAAGGNEIHLDFYTDFWGSQIPSTINVDYSDVDGGAAGVYVDTDCTLNWGEGNIDADPCLVDADNGDYHLLFTSPCIDAGDPDYITSPGEKDIDGEPRVIGGRVDMGVDEFISTLTTILRASPTEFQFSSYENGPNPKEQIMSIRNIGSGTLNWEIIGDCPWLDVYPASGESTGQMNEVTLSVDIFGMEPSSYECLLTIDAHDVLNSPQMVTVTLNLGGSELFVPSEYGTIQAAIDAAVYGDTVIVADGIYTGDGNRDIDFLGKVITVKSENGAANCIIDCQGSESEPHRGFIFRNGEGSNSILTGLTIMNGYAPRGGGIYCIGYSSPTINQCTIRGNTAYLGGGICTEEGGHCSPIIKNCIIVRNLASAGLYWGGCGGGIFFSGDLYSWSRPAVWSYPQISNCTISDNSAAGRGGGICVQFACDITINNNIIWGNTASADKEISISLVYDASNPKCKVSYSNVKDGLDGIQVYYYVDWGEGNIDVDPCFVQPGYWDSTGIWVDGDYHLLRDSPCIDAGDPNYPYDPNETDLDDRPRVVGARIDMGAYEYSPPIAAEVRIVPHTISLESRGKWITAFLWLPEGYAVTDMADIDTNSILLEYEIEPERFWFNEEKQVVMAKFSQEEVQTFLNVGEFEPSISLQLMNGTVFEGRDLIRVTSKSGGKPDKYVQASNPNPADGATGVDINADLSWTTGSYVTSHDVYFGTSSPPPFVCNQTAITFDPGTMDRGLTYYWRIDEVNKWGTTTGSVWSFTTISGGTPPPPPPPPPPP
ncbi:MAG: hypothetical protein FVQ85_20740 [Planctomycetes bacterium]|nr:hypothetical protein [Planctomycetota bacterium]